LERAGRFLYLSLAFGGKVADRSDSRLIALEHYQLILEDIHSRLAGVVIALTYSPCARSDAH
jgi:hypothetical protein